MAFIGRNPGVPLPLCLSHTHIHVHIYYRISVTTGMMGVGGKIKSLISSYSLCLEAKQLSLCSYRLSCLAQLLLSLHAEKMQTRFDISGRGKL